MTINELGYILKKTTNVTIHHAALSAIIQATDGIYVKCETFSRESRKMVKVYSIGLDFKHARTL